MTEILNILTVQVILPLLFIMWLWQAPLSDKASWQSRANWVVQVISTGAVVAFALMVGAQSWTSVYVAALLIILFVIAFARSFKHLPENWWPFQFGASWQETIFVGSQVLVGLLFVPACLYALAGYSPEEEPLALSFPLQNGVYIAGHGGSNPLINYHNVDREQRYALDLSKLNAMGTRATGVHPRSLDRYAIYGDTLFSPCRGTVHEVVTGLPDLTPPERGKGPAAGNHVVLECKGALVYLAHLMQGSVAVDSGAVVEANAPLGRVGNSGNTTEPHLHIHATRNGSGVPITFDGRFLVRNSLIWR